MSERTLALSGRRVTVRRTDKVLFPESGITKGELLDHYLGCASRMLPPLRRRPLVLQRYPDGIAGEGPPGGGLAEIRFAARAVRRLMDELGLFCALQTTGKRGYHGIVPIRAGPDYDAVHAFARRCAETLAARHPDRLTAELRKAARGRRLFVDWPRNSYGQAAVAPYAVRAVPDAPVATPIAWEELSHVAPGAFTVRNPGARLARGEDSWKGLARRARSLGPAMRRLARAEDPS